MSTTNERYKLNKELAQMLKGGVIMDVTTPVSYTHLDVYKRQSLRSDLPCGRLSVITSPSVVFR